MTSVIIETNVLTLVSHDKSIHGFHFMSKLWVSETVDKRVNGAVDEIGPNKRVVELATE